MSSDIELKKINDLRVIDLKLELEKRGLEKNGVKAVLHERLLKAMQNEGLDPEIYQFEVSNKTKRYSKSEGDKNLDESNTFDEDSERDTTEGTDNMIVTDELGEEDIIESNEIASSESDKKSAEMTNLRNEKSGTSGGIDVSLVTSTTENPNHNPHKEAPEEKDPDTCTLDNEDSINLDIADEEKLLAEDEDEQIKFNQKVDEGKEKSTEESDKNEESLVNENDEKPTVDEVGDTVKKEDGNLSTDTRETSKEDKLKSEGSSSRKKEEEAKGSKGEKRNEGFSSESRNLWVSNLSSLTRATDLKQVFSKHGKVIGAKIVTNARTPGARCYGYVTMANSDDAIRCIKHLHRIELHGRMISVEKAKGDATGPLKTSESRRSDSRRNSGRHDSLCKDKKSTDKRSDDKKPTENGKSKLKPDGSFEDSRQEGISDDKRILNKGDRRNDRGMAEKSKSRDGSRDDRGHGSHRSIHSHSPFRRRHSPRKEVLSFSQIKEERERQRLREKERRLREEAKRRREEALRQRDIDRRQKSEAARIEREKEKLRLEREKIEREKSELLRMERERQRLERERIEREKEELRMQQKRLEAARRSSKKRPSDDRREFPDKRAAINLGHFDAPPPPRFTEEDRRRERSRRDDFESDRRRDSNTSRPRDEFNRKSSSTSHGGKEARFERDRDRDRDRERDRDRDISNSTYRSRDDRRERGSSDWHSSSGQQGGAPFGSMGGPSGPSSRDPWGSSDRKPDGSSWGRSESTTSDRWASNASNMSLLGRAPGGSVIASALYQNQPVPPGLGMGLSLPSNGPYNNDRFDAYKPSISGIRKF